METFLGSHGTSDAGAGELRWSRPGLETRDGRLTIAGRDAEELARDYGTPLYTYDLERVREQARAMRAAIAGAGLRPLVRLALKAQRQPGVLAALRGLGPPGSAAAVGIDACSPGEVLHALANGWEAGEISYTGTNVSDRDLDVLLAHPIHLNVDLISQILRVGRRAPGRAIGVRVNPRYGAGHGGESETLYAGHKPTKFGIYAEGLDEALDAAREHELAIDTVHFHVGDGYLTDELPSLGEALSRVADMVRHLQGAGCPIVEINCGGGIGVPIVPGDLPLDLERWAALLATHLGGFDVTVSAEPGDFLVKEAGTLLAEVVTVETRDDVTFVGLDVGWNAMGEHFVYGVPSPIVLCRAADAAADGSVTFAGNINEGDDLYGEDIALPAVREGDIVAALGVGSYNQSLYSVHCLRDDPQVLCLPERV